MSNVVRPIRHSIQERQVLSSSKGTTSRHDRASQLGRHYLFIVVAWLLLLAATSSAQDWIRTGTGLGVDKVRLAVSDFKQVTADSASGALLKLAMQCRHARVLRC